MNWSEFRRAGHWPTLLSAFLYFDVSFMVWVVLGPLSLYSSRDLGLSLEEKFGLVAIPILAGALLRIPLGMLADHWGPKRTGLGGQLIVAAALGPMPGGSGCTANSRPNSSACCWAWPARASRSRCHRPRAGIRRSSRASSWASPAPATWGVVLDSLFVPWLAERFGWQAVFGFLLIPVLAVLALYAWLVHDAPGRVCR